MTLAAFIDELLRPIFWGLCILWLLLAYWKNANRSGKTAMLIWVVIGLCMDALIPLLGQLDKTLQRHLWYLCWMTINALTVVTIGAWHIQHHIKPCALANTISYSALAMIVVQLVRYADRLAVQTNLLGPIYQVLVPAMNIGVLLYASGWLYRELKHGEQKGC